MATTEEEFRRQTAAEGNSPAADAPSNVPFFQYPSSTQPATYKNAREYAQVLRPWLWQYYTMASMHNFMASLCPSPCFQRDANQGTSIPLASLGGFGAFGDFQQQANNVQARAPPPVNGQVLTVPHRFVGTEYRIPSFWKRVSAELIDFTILFYIKLVVTLIFMREMGFMEDILDYDFLDGLDDLDYNRAFTITYEVIAMEIVNRLLITFFETLCLRQGIGTVGGSTPGKRLMGLKVLFCTNLQDLGSDRVLVAPAGDIGWFRAFIRSIIKNFTIAFFFPACLTVFMFRHNRAAYDILSNTIVVEADDP